MHNSTNLVLPRKSPSTGPCRLARYDRPGTMVGGTPVLRVGAPFGDESRGFWAKLEGVNPGGMKDRPAMYMVERGRARGDLKPGARIVESTSGTLGLGLALAGTAYDHPVTLVTDPGMEPLMLHMLSAYGADIDLVTRPHRTGGWQQARRDRVSQILAADPDTWYPDQYNNPDNVVAYRDLALELQSQLGQVDVLVCSVGTGGHSAGVAKVLREFNSDLKLIGVDTIGSTIFGQPAQSRLMRGLGSSIYPGNVDYDAFDEVHWVAPAEAVWACRALAATSYASSGWSGGAVALVAGWAARQHAPDAMVAAIFPDGPQRYFDTVYNNDYCRRHNLLDSRTPTDPAEIADPADRVVDSWTRCTTVRNPLAAR
ncbi:PLP-dependent cysteine synthase family protein [Mycobacterium sp. MAA66]|uniref:PLP-dependent cysteine synthase family protein n=1 Tax=Mycobacterium sp. MAA66 TaxID=3156297 RepID=UPI00351289B9